MLRSTPNTEKTMPSPSAPIAMPWATKPLPDFRPRRQGEPMPEYLRLLAEFKTKADEEQEAAWQAQQSAEASARQPVSGAEPSEQKQSLGQKVVDLLSKAGWGRVSTSQQDRT